MTFTGEVKQEKLQRSTRPTQFFLQKVASKNYKGSMSKPKKCDILLNIKKKKVFFFLFLSEKKPKLMRIVTEISNLELFLRNISALYGHLLPTTLVGGQRQVEFFFLQSFFFYSLAGCEWVPSISASAKSAVMYPANGTRFGNIQ